jgi:hypothetical protein
VSSATRSVRAEAFRLALAHRVAHAADDEASAYAGEDVVGEQAVGRAGVAGKGDHRQVGA